jgi:hypothetical protein
MAEPEQLQVQHQQFQAYTYTTTTTTTTTVTSTQGMCNQTSQPAHASTATHQMGLAKHQVQGEISEKPWAIQDIGRERLRALPAPAAALVTRIRPNAYKQLVTKKVTL